MNSPVDHESARHRERPRRVAGSRRRPDALPTGTSTTRSLVVVVGAIATAVAAVTTSAGASPAPLIAIALVVVMLAIGQRVSWLAAGTTTVLGTLAGLALLMRVYPHLGTSLSVSNTTALAVASAAALIVLARREHLRLPTRADTALLASAVVVPVGMIAALAVVIIRSGGSKISWAMSNDATYSLMIARFIVRDGGDDPTKHLNAAPLTYEILATFIAPGRSSVDAGALLQHDVDRAVQALLFMLAVMSVLGAVGAAHVVPRHRVASRVAISLLMGAVPWTWFVAGLGLKYGFNNALLSGVLVTAVWIAWLETRQRPVVGTAWQALAATALVATWAPLVLVPLALGGLLLARSWRDHLRLRGWRLLVWLVPVLAFAWYMVFATLPVFQEASYALARDGAMFPSHPAYALTVFGLALAATVTGPIGHDDGRQVSGLLAVGVAGVTGAVYLVAQRLDNPAGLWGYYPAKYAWLLAMIAPVVCARAVAGRLTVEPSSAPRRAGLVTACSLLVVAVMAQFPPVDLRSQSTAYPVVHSTPDWRLASVFPVISIARNGGMSDMDAATKDLMRISDPADKVMVMSYSDDPSEDTYINYWLLWQAFDDYPQVNGTLAYELVGDAPDSAACDIVDSWSGGVEILTRDPGLERRVTTACPGADVSFTVEPSGRP